jgi:hypothetical protein
VLQGLPMGDGWYLRAFPVWFARRGNYGVLLSQAKALAAGSMLRRDPAGLELAQKQAEWIVGRNPFVQSTMYGEGYDWAQQYSVSSGDIVGALPVGMQSHGASDEPYWPSQNTYVFKEVWVHSTGRWIWLMQDLMATTPSTHDSFEIKTERTKRGDLVIHVTPAQAGEHKFALRTSNMSLQKQNGHTVKGVETFTWKLHRTLPTQPCVVLVVPDGDVAARREVACD